jgi:hypothetical protein
MSRTMLLHLASDDSGEADVIAKTSRKRVAPIVLELACQYLEIGVFVLTFLADKINLKSTGFVLTHVFLPICLAKNVQLDVLQPDAVS